MAEKKLSFSPAAQAELKVMTGAIDEIVGIAIGGFVSDSADAARRVEPLEEVIDDLNMELKARLLTSLTQTFAPRISNGLRTANAPLSWDLF